MRQLLGLIVTVIVIWGVVQYLAEPGNGRDLGRVAGNAASDGADAVGGFFDIIEGLVKGLGNH